MLEAEGHHGRGMCYAGKDAIILRVFEREVIFNEGILFRGGSDGENVFGLKWKKSLDEAHASVIADAEEGVEAFFCFYSMV